MRRLMPWIDTPMTRAERVVLIAQLTERSAEQFKPQDAVSRITAIIASGHHCRQ